MNAIGPIRIILADDHQLFRRGLRQLLELEPDIAVVAEAINGLEALRLVAEHRPQVLLLDLSMPVLDGLGTLEAVRRDYPATGVLIVTMHNEASLILRVLGAGAHGLVRKDTDAQELIGAIRSIAEGRCWLEPHAAGLLLEDYRRLQATAGRGITGRLSERDVALLRLLAGGCSNKEIATSLGLAESTVKNQLAGLFGRLGVNDRTQAALYAYANGILMPDGERPAAPAG
jgi:DNA-binding NarL/FixJ family response regulator